MGNSSISSALTNQFMRKKSIKQEMNKCTCINKKIQLRQMRENKKERGLVRFNEKRQVYKSEEN